MTRAHRRRFENHETSCASLPFLDANDPFCEVIMEVMSRFSEICAATKPIGQLQFRDRAPARNAAKCGTTADFDDNCSKQNSETNPFAVSLVDCCTVAAIADASGRIGSLSKVKLSQSVGSLPYILL